MVRVGIAGGGRGAELLINYLSSDTGVKVITIFDIQAEAPGIKLARQLGIEVAPSLEAMASRPDIDVIIEVTGNPKVLENINLHRLSTTEVIDSSAARFFIDRIRNSSARSLEAADGARLKFDAIGESLAHGIALTQDALRATEDVAAQTEVLSVNAAIEAARAQGESGRTFGVVAKEIQRVARTTKKTTEDVGQIMHSFRAQADEIRRLAEEMVATLKSMSV